MREHLHLSRVPSGAERDYIRGALIFYENEDKIGKFMGIVVNFVVSAILLASTIYGLIRYLNDGSVNFGVVILGFLFSAFWLIIPIGLFRSGNYIKKTNWFQTIRVCDVMLTEIQSSPKSNSALAKAIFADGTVSKTAFQAIFYSIYPYQYGTLVAIYDANRQCIYTKMIPKFEYGTKPYKLAQKGLDIFNQRRAMGDNQ